MNPDFTEVDKAAEPVIATAMQAQEARMQSKAAFERSAPVECVTALPGALQQAIDVYHGPEGDGYVVRLVYEFEGERWLRCVAGGPQGFRTHAWLKVRKF